MARITAAKAVVGKRGKVSLVGSVQSPAIYETVPPAEKPKARFYMERLSLSKNVWTRAERVFQNLPLSNMMQAAKSMSAYLRVVVLDWKDTPQPLEASASHGVDADGTLWVRPAKGKRKLVLTPREARQLPMMEKAKRTHDALEAIRNAPPKRKGQTARGAAAASVEKAPSTQQKHPRQPVVQGAPLVRPINPAALELRDMVARAAPRREGALADAFKRAAGVAA